MAGGGEEGSRKCYGEKAVIGRRPQGAPHSLIASPPSQRHLEEHEHLLLESDDNMAERRGEAVQRHPTTGQAQAARQTMHWDAAKTT
jgi:hypothetical protein